MRLSRIRPFATSLLVGMGFLGWTIGCGTEEKKADDAPPAASDTGGTDLPGNKKAGKRGGINKAPQADAIPKPLS